MERGEGTRAARGAGGSDHGGPARPDADALARHLPAGTAGYCVGLLSEGPLAGVRVDVRVVASRRTKVGDHRGPGRGRPAHRITLNEDLNPYAFLTTLLHEVAHALTWERHVRGRSRFARRVLPHGPQWKGEFSRILAPLVGDGSLPPDVSAALARSLRDPRAATCSDRGLVEALSRYDAPDPSRVRVEDLPVGAAFRVDGRRAFRKGAKLRSRYRCYDAVTGVEYRVHALCPVVPCAAEGPQRVSPPGRRRA